MTRAIAELLRACGSGDGVNPMRTRAIAAAKVKTDEIDAKVLAQWGGGSAGGVGADEATRALRRRIAQVSLVRSARGCAQIHAVLTRN